MIDLTTPDKLNQTVVATQFVFAIAFMLRLRLLLNRSPINYHVTYRAARLLSTFPSVNVSLIPPLTTKPGDPRQRETSKPRALAPVHPPGSRDFKSL